MRPYRKFLAALLLVAFLPAEAQTAPQQPPAANQIEPEHHISKAEAEELFRAVDDILKTQSENTGLPIKHSVRRQLTSRNEVEKFLLDRFRDDEQTKRLQRAESVLKKFGLVPCVFYLEGFLLQLLTENVAGYYEPKHKTVYLLDWVDPDLQKPVLAHELTHALQDQSVGVEKWTKRGPAGRDEVQSDERLAARQAVLEGQAMLAMMDYTLAASGQSVVTAPDIVKATEAGMELGESPTLQHAPLYLKQSLVFPYTYGLEFERQLRAKSKAQAFIEALRNPPENTRQIMQPETYLAGEHPLPLLIPDFGKLLGKAYEKFDVGSIGEFDVMIMATVYANPEAARAIFPQWRGGYYYAATRKDVKDLAVVFVTRWASTDAARKFGELYGAGVAKRYEDAGPALSQASDLPGSSVLQWDTAQGPVNIHVRGDTVVGVEGIDSALGRSAADAAFAAAQTKTAVTMAAPPELAVSVMQAAALAHRLSNH